jgi:hypothetical protein
LIHAAPVPSEELIDTFRSEGHGFSPPYDAQTAPGLYTRLSKIGARKVVSTITSSSALYSPVTRSILSDRQLARLASIPSGLRSV